MQSKRPPNLSLQIAKRPPAKTVIELPTPVEDEKDQVLEDEDYRSSSPSSSSSSSQDAYHLSTGPEGEFNSDDLSKDLAMLEELRRSVHKNLRLRPIRSASGTARSPHLPRPAASSSQSSDSPLESIHDTPDQRSPSPDSAFSAYFTPLTEFRGTPLSALYHSRNPSLDVSARSPQLQSVPSTSVTPAYGISPALLLARLSSPTRPLLIDARPVASFVSSHIQHSVNMAIPSLILRRSRKPAYAFQTLDALRQYITTDSGKRSWDELISGEDWDGDVIVYDEYMLEKDRYTHQATAWAVMDVVAPLLNHGGVDFLEGGFASARNHSYLSQLLVSDTGLSDSQDPGQGQTAISPAPCSSVSARRPPPGGLSQLDTNITSRSKSYPQVEQAAPSPIPVMPSAIQSWNIIEDYSSPSPAPSSTVFSRPLPPRRPSIPTLRRLDTERSATLPKLHVSTAPTKSNTLAAPPATGNGKSLKSRSRSPSHLKLAHSNYSPPRSAILLSPGPGSSHFDLIPPPSPSYAQTLTPLSPRTPLPPSPSTARPESQPPTTEEPFPEFGVSTILPNFLFLGPEPTSEEHVEDLLSHGVKRIINIAVECDDDHGLQLRERFERYVHIPMRDTVEEDNITRGVREVCGILGMPLHSCSTSFTHLCFRMSRRCSLALCANIRALQGRQVTLCHCCDSVLDPRESLDTVPRVRIRPRATQGHLTKHRFRVGADDL